MLSFVAMSRGPFYMARPLTGSFTTATSLIFSHFRVPIVLVCRWLYYDNGFLTFMTLTPLEC